jgi:hypothetical protein
VSEKKSKIIVTGLFILCLLSLFWHDDREAVIGFGEMVASAGAWVCAVWLWKNEWWVIAKTNVHYILAFVLAGIRIISVVLMIGGTLVVLYSLIFSASIGKVEAGKLLFVGFGIQAAGYFPFYAVLWLKKKKAEKNLQ